jgi:hypothetical protein
MSLIGLIFDEVSLCKGFHYETSKQRISGFEDLGSLGRSCFYGKRYQKKL